MGWIDADRMDYMTAVHTFYVLQDLSTLRIRGDSSTVRRAQRKLLYDANTYLKETFAPRMARTLRDYLLMVSVGEARHAGENSEAHYCISGIPSQRGEAYKFGQIYEVNSLLNGLHIIFNEQKWINGYGGKSWGTLIEKAARYGIVSNSLFIDTAVNLTHNNGLCYDKGILVSNGQDIIPFLDYRQHYDAILWGMNCLLSIEEYVYDLLHAACNLRMIFALTGENINYNELRISKQLLSFPYVSWGEEKPILVDLADEVEHGETENYRIHERPRRGILGKHQ